MGRLRNLFCVMCASLVLVSCSYFDTEGGLDISSAPARAETIDLMADRAAISSIPVDLTQAVSQASGGSVQIYSLDSGPGFTPPTPSYPAISQAAPLDIVPAAPANTQSMPEGEPPSEAFLLDRDMLDMLDGTMQDGVKNVAPVPIVPPVGRYAAMDQEIPIFSSDRNVQIFSVDAPSASASIEGGSSGPDVVGDQNMRKITVFFDHDSAALAPAALATVREVAGQFNPAERRGLTVEGHASIRANYPNDDQRRIVNLRVSMDRAFAVSRALIESGIPPEAIRVAAWGDTHPPQETYGKSLEAASRRVEISH